MKSNKWIIGLAATALLSSGGTIVAVQGPASSALPIFNSAPIQIGYASWTQSGSYDDVSIIASLGDESSGDTGVAYLSTSIGPGATALDIQSFSFPGGGAGPVTLFSGLTLGPGTYFLVVAPSDGQTFVEASWSETSSPAVVSDFGETTNGFGVASFISLANPPAVDWASVPDLNLLFSVTGNSVPEPSSGVLLGSALLGLTTLRRHWRTRAK